MRASQKTAVGSMKCRLLLASTITVAALVGTRVLADDASDIESFYGTNSYVQYDNTSGAYPIITAVASQPGSFGGHNYTGWSLLAQDSTGSLDLFVSVFTLTNLPAGPGTPYGGSVTPTVGDAINTAAQWSPYSSIPELAYTTTVASNNYLNRISTGNALPTPPVFTVNALAATAGHPLNNNSMAGYFMEVQNATISGSTGSFQNTFPTYAQANTVSESYTLTDGSGSMVMFDWVTSYSVCGALGGTPVPVGAVNIYGFVEGFGTSTEFVPLAIVSVPEPSSVLLVGAGMAGLLALRRRRRS